MSAVTSENSNAGLPLVSVVVPVYKVERWLDRCVSSIVHQTYKNLEIILVDDGSPDGSSKKCDEWADRDSRVVVLHRANEGVSAARNAGMDAAHGDYLCFVDSDDAVEPQLAETAVRAAQRYDAQIVFYANMNDRYNDEGTLLDSAQQSSVAFVAETAKEFKRHFLELSHGQYVCPPWNKLFLTSFVKQVGIRFPEGVAGGEDSAFNFHLYVAAERVVAIDEPLYRYSMRAGSTMNTFDPRLLEGRVSVHAALLPIIQEWNPTYLNDHDNRLITNVWIVLSLLYADRRPQIRQRRGTIVRGIIANPVVRECARSVNAVGTKNRLMTVLIHNGNVLATRIIMRAVNLLKRIRSKVSR